jgi:hypothetical protein
MVDQETVMRAYQAAMEGEMEMMVDEKEETEVSRRAK